MLVRMRTGSFLGGETRRLTNRREHGCCKCNRSGSCSRCACVKAGKSCENCLPGKLGTCCNHLISSTSTSASNIVDCQLRQIPCPPSMVNVDDTIPTSTPTVPDTLANPDPPHPQLPEFPSVDLPTGSQVGRSLLQS